MLRRCWAGPGPVLCCADTATGGGVQDTSSAQLWEPLLHEYEIRSGSGKCERPGCQSGPLLLSASCFYCRGIHGGLVNRRPVSDGPCSQLCIIIGGSPWNSPHAEEFCTMSALQTSERVFLRCLCCCSAAVACAGLFGCRRGKRGRRGFMQCHRFCSLSLRLSLSPSVSISLSISGCF